MSVSSGVHRPGPCRRAVTLCQRSSEHHRFPIAHAKDGALKDPRHKRQLVIQGSKGSVSRAVAWHGKSPSQVGSGGLR